MHENIHFDFWDSYDNKNNLTLFSEKSEHVLNFGLRGTLKINGSHFENATIFSISEKLSHYALLTLSIKFHTFNKYHTIMPLSYA